MFFAVLLAATLFASTHGFVHPSVSIAPTDHWHCIGFTKNLDRTRPYRSNVGDLPLVTWFDNATDLPLTTLNVCRHLGSRLHTGQVKNGCLSCPYHGLKHSANHKFGETQVFQGKLWWSYKPKNTKPPGCPFFNNKNYASSTIVIDMPASLMDCVFNTMDIVHPEHVHNGPLGFGSNIPPQNVTHYVYPSAKNQSLLGLSFVYSAGGTFAQLDAGVKQSNNFHMLRYPGSSWSRVSMPNGRNLFVNVDLLPIEKDLTRWFVTLRHNYLTSAPGRWLINVAAR